MADDARAANAAARKAIEALERDPGNKTKARAAKAAMADAARAAARAQERENARGRKGAPRVSAADRERQAVARAEREFDGFWSALLGKASKRAGDGGGGSSSGGSTKSDGSSWWS